MGPVSVPDDDAVELTPNEKSDVKEKTQKVAMRKLAKKWVKLQKK